MLFAGNVFGQTMPPDTSAGDNFESGNPLNFYWSVDSTGIVISDTFKFGAKGVTYDIQSTTQKILAKILNAIHDTSYTSTFFKMGATPADIFTMADGDQTKLTELRNSANTQNTMFINIRRSGANYQIRVNNPAGVGIGGWATLNRGQWYWIKMKAITTAAGKAEWWLDGVSQGNTSGDYSARNSGRLRLIAVGVASPIDAGTSGSIYFDQAMVTLTDHSEPEGGPRVFENLVTTAQSIDGVSWTANFNEGGWPKTLDSLQLLQVNLNGTDSLVLFVSTDIADTSGAVAGLELDSTHVVKLKGYKADSIWVSNPDTFITGNAERHYINAYATGLGDGTSWLNAWTELPADMIRGDTYFIGDYDDYPHYVFDDPDNAEGDTIYIFKATVGAHGTDIGWADSLGDGQAVFKGAESRVWLFETGHYFISGITGQDSTGYGIKVKGTLAEQILIRFLPDAGDSSSHVNFEFIEIAHRGLDQGTNDKGILNLATFPRNFDIRFGNCYIHDVSGAFIKTTLTWNWIVEDCYFRRNTSTGANHAEGWADKGSFDMTVRRNRFEDVEGTSFIAFLSGDSISHDWAIYGNLFTKTDNNPSGRGNIGTEGVIGSVDTSYNIIIYNNTIAGITGINAGFRFNKGSGNLAYNNIWAWNLTNALAFQNITHDWNMAIQNRDAADSTVDNGTLATEPNGQVGIANIFVDTSGTFPDYRLTANTDPGTTLAVPTGITIDPDGNTRDTWSRGAYEYQNQRTITNLRLTNALTTSFVFTVDTTLNGLTDFDSLLVVLASDSSLLKSFTDTTGTVTGLTPDTEYIVRVAGYVNDLDSAWSEIDTVTTQASPPTPSEGVPNNGGQPGFSKPGAKSKAIKIGFIKNKKE